MKVHEMLEDHSPFDELLAEYFDWTDRSAESGVEEFLVQAPQWSEQGELVDALRKYVRQSHEVERIATMTLSQWLELEARPDGDGDETTTGTDELPFRISDYELLEEIGRGGMGVVYRARQISLDRTVCVKMILPGRLARQVEVDRFRGEAKAMAALRHANIVSIYDVSQSGEQSYFVMEHIAGNTLADLTRSGPLPPKRAAQIVSVVAGAIAYAHQQGVLHRDLKPSNILIDEQERPHVTDFGLARRIDTGSLTSTGALAGTPGYMAPEQTRGDRSGDVACDVYGLGAVLYECITGRPPFQGDTPLDTLLQVRTTDPVRPSLIDPRLPRDLETICLKCLAKLPAGRYASAAELAADLERFSRGEPIKARPISPLARCVRWCRRNPLPVTLAATIMLAALAVGLALFRSYVVTSAALSDLQREEKKNNELIQDLRAERDHVAGHLYLSRLRRISQAVSHGDLVEADELLSDLAPAAGERDRRGWGWHYLKSLTRQFAQSWNLQDGQVRSVVTTVSSGRQWVAIAERDLQLWDVADKKIVSIVSVPNATGALAYSPQSELLAIGIDDGRVELRESQTLAASGALIDESARAAVRSVAWDHRGESLAVGYANGLIIVWNVQQRKVVVTIARHADAVNALSFSHDDRWLVSGGDDGMVQVFDIQRKIPITTLRRFRDWVNDVEFSPTDGRFVAVSQSGELRGWHIIENADSSVVTRQLFNVANRDALGTVRWNRSATRIATGGSNWTISIWQADSGHLERQLHGHRGDVTAVDWPTDELLVSCSSDATIKTWDMTLAPDGGRVSPAEAPIRCVKWNPRTPLVAWRNVDGVTSIWNRQTRSLISQFSDSVVGATALAWHPDGSRIALARDELLLVYGIPQEDQQLQLQAGAVIWTIGWSPNGRYIASAGNGAGIQIWDVTSRELVGQLQHDEQSVRTFCWISPTHLCSVDEVGTLRRWKVARQRVETNLKLDTILPISLAPNGDGSQLAVTTQEGHLVIVDLTSMTTRRLTGHQGPAWDSVWLSEDRRLMSAGQDGTLRLWDVETGEEALRIQAHSAAVWSLDKNSDGRVLVSAGADGVVRFWDASGDTAKDDGLR